MKLKTIKERKAEYKAKVHNMLLALCDDNRCIPIDSTDKLYKLENRITRLSEYECNGIEGPAEKQEAFLKNLDIQRNRLERELSAIIPRRLQEFIVVNNTDPRGYALKLSSEFNGHLYQLERDMDGDYILCPQF